MTTGEPGRPGETGLPGEAGNGGHGGAGGTGGRGGTGGAGGAAAQFRYAFIALVLLSLILTGVSLLYTARVDRESHNRDELIADTGAQIRTHKLVDQQVRAALCSVLPALEQHVVPAARPDFAQLARALHCPPAAPKGPA